MSVGLSDAQVDEAGHRQTHVEPVTEAEIVDELEDVLHTQEDQPHQPLQAPTQRHTVNLLCQKEKKSRVHNVHCKVRNIELVDGSHIEQQGRYGRVTLQVNQTQAVGEVALSGSNKEQPAQSTNNRGFGHKRPAV